MLYEIFLTGNYNDYKTICIIRNYDYTTRIQMLKKVTKAITVYSSSFITTVSEQQMFIIKSYMRETLKAFDTPYTGEIVNIFIQ